MREIARSVYNSFIRIDVRVGCHAVMTAARVLIFGRHAQVGFSSKIRPEKRFVPFLCVTDEVSLGPQPVIKIETVAMQQKRNNDQK